MKPGTTVLITSIRPGRRHMEIYKGRHGKVAEYSASAIPEGAVAVALLRRDGSPPDKRPPLYFFYLDEIVPTTI